MEKVEHPSFYITCVLIEAFMMGSTCAFLCSCAAFASFLLRFSFCSSSGRPLALFLGVSVLVCPLVGVEGALFSFRGLILIWGSLCGVRRRLDLRGLLLAGESGRSPRGFLRGVRLMVASDAGSVCFLLEGVDKF